MSNRMTDTTGTGTDTGTLSLLRTMALAVGAVFLLVGVLGFVPGITTHYGDMELAGHESGAKLLGIFQVSVLHNIVHLLFGVAGVALSRRSDTAFNYLVVGGLVYVVLFVYGLVVGRSPRRQLRAGQQRRRLAAPGAGPGHDRARLHRPQRRADASRSPLTRGTSSARKDRPLVGARPGEDHDWGGSASGATPVSASGSGEA